MTVFQEMVVESILPNQIKWSWYHIFQKTMFYLMKSKYAIFSNIKVTKIERYSFFFGHPVYIHIWFSVKQISSAVLYNCSFFCSLILPGTVRAPVFGRHQFFGTSEHYGKTHGILLTGWMNYNYTACCWFPTSSNILILPSQFWRIGFESYWLHCSKCQILVLLQYRLTVLECFHHPHRPPLALHLNMTRQVFLHKHFILYWS